MKLKTLLKEIPACQVKGSKEILITGISANSKVIAPGNLFIVKKGRIFDGIDYINEAIKGGAVAIVTDLFDPTLKQVVQIIHQEVLTIQGQLAATFYKQPSQKLFMVGVTGTSGKTTTSFIIKYLLDQFIGTCGLIGTIEYITGKNHYHATHTTPDVVTNHKMLYEMLNYGCRSAVMEVSSHALDQGRVDDIDFDVAIFSNLTHEHLDYHGSMENYAKAKKKIFERLGKEKSGKKSLKWAIVNNDSPWTPRVLEGCSANTFTYGISNFADLQATRIELEEQGTQVQLTYQGQKFECYWPLIGHFNVYNCLAAMAVLLCQQVPMNSIVNWMHKIPFVRGRLQPVENCLGLKIYVDFAHKENALMNVLQTLKNILHIRKKAAKNSKGRLIVIFGCGGDRDRSKRPQMARTCENYADFCIVTSDNPRTEDPKKICEEIISGFSKKDFYQVIVDRKMAIERAIEMAQPEDILLIAGKGHETHQILNTQTIEFDDCQVVAEICKRKGKCF